MMKNYIALFILFVVNILSLIGISFYVINRPHIPHITVRSQAVGSGFIVQQTTIPRGGFIVIADLPNGDGVGESPYYPSGLYEDVSVSLYEDQPAIAPGTVLYATLFEDTDGDQMFSIVFDRPYVTSQGKPIQSRFSVKQ